MQKTLIAGCCAIALGLPCLLAGCVSDEEACAELDSEDACMEESGCAWGTDAGGPHCFYVGDVELQ
jgi:hypothetical protein